MRSTGEARRASWWSPYGLLRLYVLYCLSACMWSYIVAQIRYLVYRNHFNTLEDMEWLKYI